MAKSKRGKRRGPVRPEGASGPNQTVVPHERGWAIMPEGGEKASQVVEYKALAIDRCVGIARRYCSEVVIHDTRGREQARFDPLEEPDHMFLAYV